MVQGVGTQRDTTCVCCSSRIAHVAQNTFPSFAYVHLFISHMKHCRTTVHIPIILTRVSSHAIRNHLRESTSFIRSCHKCNTVVHLFTSWTFKIELFFPVGACLHIPCAIIFINLLPTSVRVTNATLSCICSHSHLSSSRFFFFCMFPLKSNVIQKKKNRYWLCIDHTNVRFIHSKEIQLCKMQLLLTILQSGGMWWTFCTYTRAIINHNLPLHYTQPLINPIDSHSISGTWTLIPRNT